MDITKFAVAKTGRMVVLDANGDKMLNEKGEEMAIVFHSPGSKKYANATTNKNNRLTDRLKKKGKADQTTDQRLEDDAQFLADCTSEFENIEFPKITDPRHLHIAVYTKTEIGFICDQSAGYLGDWGNFSKPSATS